MSGKQDPRADKQVICGQNDYLETSMPEYSSHISFERVNPLLARRYHRASPGITGIRKTITERRATPANIMKYQSTSARRERCDGTVEWSAETSSGRQERTCGHKAAITAYRAHRAHTRNGEQGQDSRNACLPEFLDVTSNCQHLSHSCQQERVRTYPYPSHTPRASSALLGPPLGLQGTA